MYWSDCSYRKKKRELITGVDVILRKRRNINVDEWVINEWNIYTLCEKFHKFPSDFYDQNPEQMQKFMIINNMVEEKRSHEMELQKMKGKLANGNKP